MTKYRRFVKKAGWVSDHTCMEVSVKTHIEVQVSELVKTSFKCDLVKQTLEIKRHKGSIVF